MHVASSTMAGSRPLQEIYDALGIHYAKGGVEVYTAHIEDLHGVEVKKAGNRICIRYSEPAFLYRGVVGVVIILIPHIILGIVEIKFAVFGFINGNFRL